MAALKAERNETQQAREERLNIREVDGTSVSAGQPAGKKVAVLTPAQEAKKRKLDDRRALIEAKRIKVRDGSGHWECTCSKQGRTLKLSLFAIIRCLAAKTVSRKNVKNCKIGKLTDYSGKLKVAFNRNT